MTNSIEPENMTLLEQIGFYSNLLNHCNDLIHRVTPEGRFLYVNQAWRDTLGYSKEEIKELSLMDIVDPSWKRECQCIFDALLGGDKIEQNETVFLTRNGQAITVEGRCQTTFENGKPIAMTGIFRNVTDRIKADTALRESEMRYRTLFENSSDLMQIVSSDGHFLHVNPAWLKTFGYSGNEIKDLTIFDLISTDCQGHCSETFQEVITDGKVHEIDTTFVSKSGDRVEIEGNAKAIFKDGSPLYSQCLFRDVTEKKKMEKELLKAQKLESIGVFAGGLAHDFNNLLTAVLGNISLARATSALDTALAERLEKIETATLRAKGLTQQLLTFAKGGEPIKKLSGVANVVRDSVDFPLRGSNIKREYSFAPDLWDAEVDEDQLSQVIQNLVINAGQAMPDGGFLKVSGENVTLSEYHHTGLKAGPYLLITLSDEGHGVSQKDQAKIFDPYFSSKKNGSGLGLAVAYAIMKKHDGLITVDSEPDKGSTFSLYLPASPVQRQATEKQAQERPIVGGNILIMDDEKIVCEVAKEMLEFLGYSTSSASDGEEALKMYQEALEKGNAFDAVLMDLTIPGGLGGRETMVRLLEIDPQAHGIVSSGYANDPIMARFKDYGFSAVVPKPYKLDDLRTSLARVILRDCQE
ncbi:MAG: PAS domain S-box protein [Desulfocapsa sp.]|nr:PAS domain S-box protein [Desulfocapsa sp.]